jgi:hypothetical protein
MALKIRPLRFLAHGLLVWAAAGLFGCASSPSSQSASYAQLIAPRPRADVALPGQPGCFWRSNFKGSWTVLNDRELIVFAPFGSHAYLIALFEPVPDLRFHRRLGLEDDEGTGLICDRSLAGLVVPHWQPHRVPIVAVHALTQPQLQRLLTRGRGRGQRRAASRPDRSHSGRSALD